MARVYAVSLAIFVTASELGGRVLVEKRNDRWKLRATRPADDRLADCVREPLREHFRRVFLSRRAVSDRPSMVEQSRASGGRVGGTSRRSRFAVSPS
jgi:hypothetical protein